MQRNNGSFYKQVVPKPAPAQAGGTVQTRPIRQRPKPPPIRLMPTVILLSGISNRSDTARRALAAAGCSGDFQKGTAIQGRCHVHHALCSLSGAVAEGGGLRCLAGSIIEGTQPLASLLRPGVVGAKVLMEGFVAAEEQGSGFVVPFELGEASAE